MTSHTSESASEGLKISAMRQVTPRLAVFEPPPGLAAFVSGLVHRDERVDGRAVRLLPDVRTSIQIMLADPYHVRERGQGENWHRLPRIALWGPRHDWGYGYVQGHVTCFAIGLTPAGFRAIAESPVRDWLNQVGDLTVLKPGLAAGLDPLAGEAFNSWRARIASTLSTAFAGAEPLSFDWQAVTQVLAGESSGAIAQAARLSGLSERQFRRVFEAATGVTPKRYQRALRVDRMIRQLHPAPWEDDMTPDIPIPFADQPHAIREFRALTGLTPVEYARLKRGGDATLRSVGVDGLDLPSQS
ncbi:MAG: helix-turn-helix domain-containing protein [Caulobacterales bacterium]|uniref:helix-turn-helix domain-containing protein n=1 Tax=Glycocaulis sp. TaxID=1969725 RepID=UPI003FA0FA60